MAVDPFGDVHVVWSEETDEGRSFISYSHLAEGQWTPANEILTSRWSQSADYPSIVSDSLGNLHLVWLGDANIYYSTAYAPRASSAWSWSDPMGLEYIQNNIGKPQLIVDPNDNLYLVYSIMIGENSGIFFMNSVDHGMNWSDPVIIYKNNFADKMVDYPRLAVGEDGSLHVVWVEFNYPETFPPISIRYASSMNAGMHWSQSLSLADGPYSFPTIITRHKEVHVVWSGTHPDRFKFHRWSKDNGKTWQPTWRNTEVGGYQGSPDLVIDSADIIHWLTTGSVFRIGIDSVYHAQWENEQWLPGEVMLQNKIETQNPYDVAAEIRLGNELYVAVQYPLASNSQPEGWQNDIYLLQEDLGTPLISTKSIPNETSSQPTASISPTEANLFQYTPTIQLETNYQSSNPLTPILVGIVASIVILLISFLSRRRLQ